MRLSHKSLFFTSIIFIARIRQSFIDFVTLKFIYSENATKFCGLLRIYELYCKLFSFVQDARADVILKYSADEARNLKSYGEFPETVKINETVSFGEEGIDDDIEFDDVESSDEEDIGVDGIDNIQKETNKLNSSSLLGSTGFISFHVCLILVIFVWGCSNSLQVHYCIKIPSSLLSKIHPRMKCFFPRILSFLCKFSGTDSCSQMELTIFRRRQTS